MKPLQKGCAASTESSATRQGTLLPDHQAPQVQASGVTLKDQIAAIEAEIECNRQSFGIVDGPNKGQIIDEPGEPPMAHRVACLEETKRILTALREDYCADFLTIIGRMSAGRAHA
jgi:hypothetical protein